MFLKVHTKLVPKSPHKTMPKIKISLFYCFLPSNRTESQFLSKLQIKQKLPKSKRNCLISCDIERAKKADHILEMAGLGGILWLLSLYFQNKVDK